MAGVRLIDRYKLEFLFGGVPSTTTTLWLNMATYSHVSLLIGVANPASGITTSAVTVNQGVTVAGTSSKALAYASYFKGTGGYAAQTAASDVLTQVTGAAGTFNTATTVSVNFLYVVEVQDTDLDLANGFNAIQVAIATGGGSVFQVHAVCFGRFAGNYAANYTALV